MTEKPSESTPSVSIVVPTYNRPGVLIRALDSLRRQDYGACEIVVVDQSESPSDDVLAYVRAHQIHYHRLDRPNRCRAKSFGVLNASGHIVLVCDDDIVAPPNLVSTHVRHFRDPRIGAVSCRVYEEGQPITHTTRVLCISFYGRLYSNCHSLTSKPVEFLAGPNMSFRRALFEKVGTFDERFVGSGIMEEPDIAIRIRRLGYRIYFDASVTVLHYPQRNGNLALREQGRTGWYRDFFHNFVFFQRKYGRGWFALTSLPYHVLLAARQVVLRRLGLRDFLTMMGGYANGFRMPLD